MSTHLSPYLCLYLPVYLDCLFIHLPTCLPTRLSVYLPAYLCTYLTTCLFSPLQELYLEKPTTEQQRASPSGTAAGTPPAPVSGTSLTGDFHQLQSATLCQRAHRCLCGSTKYRASEAPGPKSGELEEAPSGYIAMQRGEESRDGMPRSVVKGKTVQEPKSQEEKKKNWKAVKQKPRIISVLKVP